MEEQGRHLGAELGVQGEVITVGSALARSPGFLVLSGGMHLLGRKAVPCYRVRSHPVPLPSTPRYLYQPHAGLRASPRPPSQLSPVLTFKNSQAGQALKLRVKSLQIGRSQTRSSMWCAGVTTDPRGVFIFNWNLMPEFKN